jgi:hypothetical protein
MSAIAPTRPLKNVTHLEPRTVVLLLGASMGLGMAVHEGFFAVALAVAIVAIADAALQHRTTRHAHP